MEDCPQNTAEKIAARSKCGNTFKPTNPGGVVLYRQFPRQVPLNVCQHREITQANWSQSIKVLSFHLAGWPVVVVHSYVVASSCCMQLVSKVKCPYLLGLGTYQLVYEWHQCC